MLENLSHLLDKVSSFLAHRKGLLPLVGLVLILFNFILQFIGNGWMVESNLLLHLGLILAIIGFMLAWAL